MDKFQILIHIQHFPFKEYKENVCKIWIFASRPNYVDKIKKNRHVAMILFNLIIKFGVVWQGHHPFLCVIMPFRVVCCVDSSMCWTPSAAKPQAAQSRDCGTASMVRSMSGRLSAMVTTTIATIASVTAVAAAISTIAPMSSTIAATVATIAAVAPVRISPTGSHTDRSNDQ